MPVPGGPCRIRFQDRDVVELLLSDVGRQAGCVADVYEPEGLLSLADAQHDLVLVALDPGNRQLTTGPVLKELFEDVAEQVAGLPALPKHELLQVDETAGENVAAVLVEKTGLLSVTGEDPLDFGGRCTLALQELRDEGKDLAYVGNRGLLGLGSGGLGHAGTDENPERFLDVVGHINALLVLVELQLLVKTQKAGSQVREFELGEGPRKVEDAVVLAVAVLVKVPVRIVEQDRLRVGCLDIGTLCGSDSLLQRRRILEDETLLRQAGSDGAPLFMPPSPASP